MQKANPMTEIAVANITLGNHQPMSLIGGMNVIESRDLVMRVAEAFLKATDELGLPYIFKACMITSQARISISEYFSLSVYFSDRKFSARCARGPLLRKHSRIIEKVGVYF